MVTGEKLQEEGSGGGICEGDTHTRERIRRVREEIVESSSNMQQTSYTLSCLPAGSGLLADAPSPDDDDFIHTRSLSSTLGARRVRGTCAGVGLR